MVAPCLSGSLLGFDSARYGDFDFDKRFRICQPLLKSDTQSKSIQNKSFIIIIHLFILYNKIGKSQGNQSKRGSMVEKKLAKEVSVELLRKVRTDVHVIDKSTLLCL